MSAVTSRKRTAWRTSAGVGISRCVICFPEPVDRKAVWSVEFIRARQFILKLE